VIIKWTKKRLQVTIGTMSSPDAVPLPRRGEVFFDVRGSSRSMRLSWYSDSAVAVFSIWQGGVCTGTFRLAIDDLPRMVQVLSSGPGASHPGAAGYPGAAGSQQATAHAHAAGYPETGYPPAGGSTETAGYPETPGYPERPGYPEAPGYPETPGYSGRPGYPETPGYSDPAGYPETASYRGKPAADPGGFRERPGYPEVTRYPETAGYRSAADPDRYGAAETRGNGYPDGAYAAPSRPGNGYGTSRRPGNGDPAGHGSDGAHPAAGQREISHFSTTEPAGYPEAGYPESSADGNRRASGLAWPAETSSTRYRPGGDSASQIRPNGYGDRAGAEGVPDADSFTYPQLAGSASGAEQHRDRRPDVP
jgi:hypothetical protein